nr:MAG TPA: hypothetical protein [Caudoviricetes sp.]
MFYLLMFNHVNRRSALAKHSYRLVCLTTD